MSTSSRAMAPPPLRRVRDQFGRTFSYMRVSVTDRCNLRCEYCSPNGTCPSLAPEPLSWDDLFWLVETPVERMGVRALRITGGEPTVRPGLVEWVNRARGLEGLEDIALTTNGVRMEKMAPLLAAAGVSRVNVSMDSLDRERFRGITRGGDLDRVLAGIAACKDHFRQVKVNVVALKGRNTTELTDFVEFSDRENIEVRFIEPMPLGDEKDYWREVFVSVDDLRGQLEREGARLLPCDKPTGFGPARTWRVAGTRARIGFISQMSRTKCSTCNKLRLTSDGTLRPCLLSAKETSLAGIIARRDSDALVNVMSGAFRSRPREYDLEEAIRESLGRSMQCIGG